MREPIRVGAVNYLNTKPLIENLESIAPEIALSLEVPSRLADQLAGGKIDVGLIPVIEYFRAGGLSNTNPSASWPGFDPPQPPPSRGGLGGVEPRPSFELAGDNPGGEPRPSRGYSIVPGISIASRGPVLSVTLFSRLPWPKIRRIALDEGSRTSAALTKIICAKRHGIRPECVQLPLEADPEKVDADAVLLIGDRAMRACMPGFVHAYDLGQEWHEWTGLPFVYAFWAVRSGVELGAAEEALHEAKRQGLERIGEIAQRESKLLGLDAGFCRRYLQTIIQFDLGPREQAGLHHFYMLACELGLARRGVSLDYYGQPDLVESR